MELQQGDELYLLYEALLLAPLKFSTWKMLTSEKGSLFLLRDARCRESVKIRYARSLSLVTAGNNITKCEDR